MPIRQAGRDLLAEIQSKDKRIKELEEQIRAYESRPASVECPNCKIKIKAV